MNAIDQRFHNLFEFFADHYFRAELKSDEEITENSKSVIFAMNHSGMNFPWDCFMLFFRMRQKFGIGSVTPLSAPALFRTRILHPFAISRFWTLVCQEASLENFERLASNNQNILVNPEGIDGIAKGFDKRYQLQKFSSSFVWVALKYDRDIVPVYAINGEYLNPFAYRINLVNSLARRIGVPFISVGLMTPLFMLFPFALYIALPARMRYITGKRIRIRDYTSKSYSAVTRAEVREICEKIRAKMQLELDQHVTEYGKTRFGFLEFFGQVKKLGFASLKLLPLAWPFLFHTADRQPTYWGRIASCLACTAMVLPVIGWPLFIVYLTLSQKPLAPAEVAEGDHHEITSHFRNLDLRADRLGRGRLAG